jgi:hypothetical protein
MPAPRNALGMDASTSEALAFGLIWASLFVGFWLVLDSVDRSADE